MHVVFGDPAEHDLAAEQLLVSYLLAVLGLKVHVDLVSAVISVTQNRMSQMGELRPDLMSPARNEL